MKYNPNLAQEANREFELKAKLEARRKLRGVSDKTNETIEERVKNETNVSNKFSGYIYLPSEGIYIAKGKSHLGLNWYKCHEELHKQNLLMLKIPQFIEFIKYLKQNPNGVGDASKDEIETILDDILTVRDPWRAEWLDADFKVDNEQLHINYNHRTVNNELVPQNQELLTDYLTQNKTPGIDLDEWLNSNTHGLPKPGIKKGDLYYWAPMKDNKSVAGFVVDSAGAGLDCRGRPEGTDASLGVRASRPKAGVVKI